MNGDRIPLLGEEALADQRSREDPALRAVWTLLETVKDPEIPVLSLNDLGILRGVHREGSRLRVVITPTYSGCPAMRAIEDEVLQVLRAAGYEDVCVETRLAPAWTTDWMSEDARERLRAWGIAPPHAAGAGNEGEDPVVACPQCGSSNTKRVSEFGSTACKALYQCLECREPFDYFKCI
jgi:ring-1,2-phenylacetyl-CoA epoxidase subunit PaaD